MDSGMFAAVQHAAATALTGPQDSVRELCRLYAHRRDLLVAALREAGMRLAAPKGTIYLWAPVPEGHTSGSFAELVLNQADVIVSPGAAYGPSGEGYVRFSLTVSDDRLRAAVDRIAQRVKL
jgi:LL-diaminopimelate aminotransferase